MNEILIGKGIDEIRFGMTQDEIKKIYGEPDEIEEFKSSDEENDNTVAFHYDEIEASVSFDELDNWKLNSIYLSDPEVTLNGKKIIGLSIDELYEVLEPLNLGEIEEENVLDEDDPDGHVVSIMKSSINFWLEDNIVKEIEFSPLYDENDNVIWAK